MIEAIDRRLVVWGESVADVEFEGRRQSAGFSLELSGGGSLSSMILVDVDVDEIEKAVKSLSDSLRQCVKELYVEMDSTLEQKAKALRISKSTLLRKRDKAHVQINNFLYAKVEKNKIYN